jgi:hypothetical protein
MSRHRSTQALALFALVLTLAIAPVAIAQDTSPFSPLPPATPEQTATTTATSSSSTQDDSGIKTWQAVLIVIGGVVLLGGIGIAIARDARRRAPVIDAAHASTDHRDADSHQRARQTKQRQRQRGKAAKAARRKNR